MLCLGMCLTLVGCSKHEATSYTDFFKKTSKVINNTTTISSESGVDDFDLNLLKMIQEDTNQIYSPLSIKYALSMLSDASSGKTKEQIDAVLGGYVPNKYTNSENLSLGNLFVVRDTIASGVSDEFTADLALKYNADVMIDSFESTDKVNNWISNKTLNMIDGYLDAFDPELQFMIINALAIDMEWVNKIQDYFDYSPAGEDYSRMVDMYYSEDSQVSAFDGGIVEGVELAAVANKYDPIADLGEDKIKELVSEDLRNELSSGSYTYEEMSYKYGTSDIDTIINNYVDDYMEGLQTDTNYGYYDESTDFYYYVDDDIKVFAKDLKEYDGQTFQYIGIMPKTQTLSEYVDSVDAETINTIVDNLIDPSYDTFEEGYITEVVGDFPIFSYSYDMDLDSCLKELGMTEMYEGTRDFTEITENPVNLAASHKSLIEFSNDGIKAAAITAAGGLGADSMYKYELEVPVKTIDLSFNNPYMYLIRNKETGDIWFVGTVYEGKQGTANLRTSKDSVEIKAEPSEDAETVEVCEAYAMLNSTGVTKVVDDEVWYEVDNGWVAQNDLYITAGY